MKKFILTLLILGFLALAAVIAAVPYFTKVIGPDMMADIAPPTGVPMGFREFPLPERSVVAIKLELPVEALAQLANKNVPPELKGVERRNLHQKITQGTLQWKMMPGSLIVKNTGRDLAYSLPVRGSAHSTGRFGLLKVRVQGSADMRGAISGRFTPTIDPSWQIRPHLTTSLTVDRAIANLGRMGMVDVRNEVQTVAGPMIQSQVAKIGPGLTKALNLKPGIQKLWNQAHITKKMPKIASASIVFDPGLAEMGPIDYSSPHSLSLTVGMIAQSFISNTETKARQPETLPYLNLVKSNPVTAIRVPIITDLKILNQSLIDRVFLIKTKMGAAAKISQPQLEMGKSGFLNLNMNATALLGSWGNKLTGKIRVQAKPLVDCKTQTLGFTDVKLSVQSKETITGTAVWLFEELLVKAIQKELRIDLKDHLPELEMEIHKVIAATPVPAHTDLYFEKPKVELLGVYTINRTAWNAEKSPGIVFVLGAKGKISVRMNQLSLAATF